MIVNYNGKDVKLPDFLIVGAMKSGTTSLYYYIKQHPQVFMPKAKELYFFSFMDAPPPFARQRVWQERIVLELDEYISHFKEAKDGQVIGEATPFYLYTYKDTIANIKRVYKEKSRGVKIIVILRNPSERAWSHFMMDRRDGIAPFEDFGEALKPEVINRALKNAFNIGGSYVSFGMYYEQVKAFMEEFPEVKVILYDELCKDDLKVVKEMFEFLSVDDGFIPDTKIKYNPSGDAKFNLLNRLITVEHPLKRFLRLILPWDLRQKIKQAINEKNIQKQEMPDDIRKELTALYKDNVLKLQALIKNDLSVWLKAS